MPEPRQYRDYAAQSSQTVVSACLHVATVLGDLLQTDLTVIGGLAPTLLVPQEALRDGDDAHCGTVDLDLGLSLAVLDARLYATIAERLRVAGFSADVGQSGQRILQRWRAPGGPPAVTIDFLIPPSLPDDTPGRLRHLEGDLAAIITPGLGLVALDWRLVSVRGRTLWGEVAERRVRVCGPGAFTILKARALRHRGLPKDAYDLCYVLRYWEGGIDGVADAVRPLIEDPYAREAIQWLSEDFATLDSLGPTRVALFRHGGRDDDLQADACGAVLRLLDLCTRGGHKPQR